MTRSCRCSAWTTGCCTGGTHPARAPRSCWSAWPTWTGSSPSAARGWSSGTGRPEQELPALAAETGASEVHLSADPSPFEAIRGRRVRAALDQAGVAGHAHPGVSVVDDVRGILTGQGRPYTVFTPFHRNWQGPPGGGRCWTRPAARHAARDPARPGAVAGQPGSAPGSGRARPGRESAGLARLAAFLDGPVRDYDSGRDQAGADGSSRLSPYLRFGCLSPRAVEDQLTRRSGGDARGEAAPRRQLCWRDFYQHVLVHHPENSRQEFQPRYRGTLAGRVTTRTSPRGPRAGPGSRWWTRACGSCAGKAGCTTGCGCWRARS